MQNTFKNDRKMAVCVQFRKHIGVGNQLTRASSWLGSEGPKHVHIAKLCGKYFKPYNLNITSS